MTNYKQLMKNKLKTNKDKVLFLLFYNLYRLLNGWALNCYEIYWSILNKMEKK
jgi:hypothetical protein